MWGLSSYEIYEKKQVKEDIFEYHAHFLNEINAILWVIDSNEHSNITKNQKTNVLR